MAQHANSTLWHQGHRFTARGSDVRWREAMDKQPGDVDFTDMSDEEFEAALCRAIGIFKFAITPATPT